MFWIAPVAGAVISAYMAHQQQKAQNDARKEQARFNMYAPIFGQAPQPLGAAQDKVTPAVLQGALSGYQMMAQHQMNQKMENYYDKMSANDSANPNASIPISEAFAPTANLYAAAPPAGPFQSSYFDPNNLLAGR
jgi:hypothetical protein